MGRGGTPAREISFVSLVAYGPKVSDSALAMGGLQLLKPGRAVPNNIPLGFELDRNALQWRFRVTSKAVCLKVSHHLIRRFLFFNFRRIDERSKDKQCV